MVEYERELAKPGLAIGDADALLNWYELLPEEFRYCDVHNTAEPSEPPEPPESPGPGPEPGTSEEPTWPPVESYEPFIPPIWEPTPTPTIEPWEPGVDPALPSEDPYIPADDWWNAIAP